MHCTSPSHSFFPEVPIRTRTLSLSLTHTHTHTHTIKAFQCNFITPAFEVPGTYRTNERTGKPKILFMKGLPIELELTSVRTGPVGGKIIEPQETFERESRRSPTPFPASQAGGRKITYRKNSLKS